MNFNKIFLFCPNKVLALIKSAPLPLYLIVCFVLTFVFSATNNLKCRWGVSKSTMVRFEIGLRALVRENHKKNIF